MESLTCPRLISIIIPAFNEEDNLPAVFERVTKVMDSLPGFGFEAIILDNASTDCTSKLAAEFCRADSRWKYLRYSRNFGTEASLLAGLDHARGDAVVNLFSDLQDPPELIPSMVNLWLEGADVVYGKLTKRNDGNWIKTLGARIAYPLICYLSDCKIVPNATDFRLMDKRVVTQLRALREPDRYMRGLVHWVGFKQVPIPYERALRTAGKSTAGLYVCFKFALHAIICFSKKPLELMMFFGFIITLGSIMLSLVYLALYVIQPVCLTKAPPGITTIFLLLLFMIGSNAFFLGVIGEYVGRIYNQGKNRMLYIVERKVNF